MSETNENKEPGAVGSDSNEGLGDWVLTTQKYLCPKHGEIISVVRSTIPSHEGIWCQICWLEVMERNGVYRVLPLA